LGNHAQLDSGVEPTMKAPIWSSLTTNCGWDDVIYCQRLKCSTAMQPACSSQSKRIVTYLLACKGLTASVKSSSQQSGDGNPRRRYTRL